MLHSSDFSISETWTLTGAKASLLSITGRITKLKRTGLSRQPVNSYSGDSLPSSLSLEGKTAKQALQEWAIGLQNMWSCRWEEGSIDENTKENESFVSHTSRRIPTNQGISQKEGRKVNASISSEMWV